MNEAVSNIFKQINILQCQEEVEWLFTKLDTIDIDTIMEIGIYNGGSLALWDYYLTQRYPTERKQLVGVDIDLSNNTFDPKYGKNILTLIEADTRLVEFPQKYLNIFGSHKVDFLFIDGDHGYEAAKHDFFSLLPLVREGGIIAFHDINTEPNNVGKFFTELEWPTKDEIKIVQGIGIIVK